MAQNSRINALYELGKNKVTTNRELAGSKRKADTFINVESIIASERIDALYEHGSNHYKNKNMAQNSRINALYELGKNKVTTNRELAGSKRKADTFINVESIIASERIDALYEH